MVKPRIKIINRCGFLAYQVVKIGPINPFANSIIWFEGKRHINAGDNRVFFRPGEQPRLKRRLSDLARLVNKPIQNPYFKN
jgi:hypothetical protein